MSCELARYADARSTEHTYFGRFERLNFPTDHFDRVTCHDVLEHVPDPVATVGEALRTLKPGGVFTVDFPAFWNDRGEHHWKPEHLWFLTPEHLQSLLQKAGFRVISTSRPIETKVVVHAVKPLQQRPSILLPPGIGDSYWSLVKLRAFLRREKLPVPEIHIACNRELRHSGHKRAFPFIELVPFCHSSGVTHESGRDPELMALWKEAYAQEGRTIFKDVVDCDWFISYNGHLRVGKQLEDLDLDLPCEWFLPLWESLKQRKVREQSVQQYGRYVVCYFVFQGTYSHWTRQFPVTEVVVTVNKLKSAGLTPVFVGAGWDAEEKTLQQVLRGVRGAVNLLGKTSVQELFGLIQGAEAVVGYPSGLTIMGTVLRKKTLIIWNDYYNEDFFWHCAPPETRGTTYFVETTRGLTSDRLSGRVLGIVEGKSVSAREAAPAPRPVVPVPRSESRLLRVVCVLKTGGGYNSKHVGILRDSVARNSGGFPYTFVPYSDDEALQDSEPLKEGLSGWWSKLELFRDEGPALYLDLDTVVVGDLRRLFQEVSELRRGEFRMLKPFNEQRRVSGKWASGVMAWHGDFRFLLDDLTLELQAKHRLDQEYITAVLASRKIPVHPINRSIGLCSYKRHLARFQAAPPSNVSLVCFHGNPRPDAVAQLPWMKAHWRAGS